MEGTAPLTSHLGLSPILLRASKIKSVKSAEHDGRVFPLDNQYVWFALELQFEFLFFEDQQVHTKPTHRPQAL